VTKQEFTATPGKGDSRMRYRAEAEHLRASASWRPLECIFWLLPVAAYFLLPRQLVLLSRVAVMGMFALSLDLILGYAGVISLGHAAFFGLGGYTAGILAQHGIGEPLSGLVIAGIFAAGLGFATSFLVLRGSDLTRLMVTLGICLMLSEIANKMRWLTGGADGLQGVVVWPILGVWNFDLQGRTAYVYSIVMLFLAFLVVRRIIHSPFGLALRGIKENERRMHALGTPVARRLVVAYTIGAALAGIAGALLTETTQFVSLDVLSFGKSAEVLLVVVLGGAGTLYGGLIGAFALIVAQYLLSGISPEYWQFWIGVAFIAIVFLARGGLVGLSQQALASLRRRLPGRARPSGGET
jgi:branched-chain amino acid transport system permease protein